MADSIKKISRTLIIPEGSVERFLNFQQMPGGRDWFGNGVFMAGNSELEAGYIVRHAQAKRHLAVYCTSGFISYKSRGESGRCGKGEFLFLPAGKFQELTVSSKSCMTWFLLEPEDLRWRFLEDHSSCVCRAWHHGKEICELEKMLFQETQNFSMNAALLMSSFCNLILAYLERELDFCESSSSVRNKTKLKKVWGELRKSPGRAWSVPQMAGMAGMSVSHFHALVSELCGCGPHEVLNKLRMEHASSLLLHTELTLESIAQELGFSTAFAFSRSFKKYSGMSPKKFRAS